MEYRRLDTLNNTNNPSLIYFQGFEMYAVEKVYGLLQVITEIVN